MRKYFILAVIFFWLAGVSFATPDPALAPTPEMFAYAVQVNTSGKNAFYELELPLEIYQKSTRRDLGDIRVFNGAGQVVPHALRRPKNLINQNYTIYNELPFFPIKGEGDQKIDDFSFYVDKNEKGTIVDIKMPAPIDASKKDKISSYLVDASAFKEAIYAIRLDWSDNQTDFMANIIVDGSDDLSNWHTIVTATVARLEYQGHQLDRNEILLNNKHYKYLRLSWPTDQSPINLTRVAVLMPSFNTLEIPERRWLAPKVVPISGETGKYLIDLKGFLPVDRVRLRFSESNVMAKVILSSGEYPEGPMQLQWRGLVYNFNYKEEQIVNPLISVSPTEHRFWMIALEETESEINSLPVLELSWQARRLVFLAQGAGPFQICYGSSQVDPINFHVDELLKKYKTSVGRNITPIQVNHSSSFIMGGEKQLKPLPPELPWKKYLLWIVMFAAVFVIGWMSTLLYKQLQSEGSNR